MKDKIKIKLDLALILCAWLLIIVFFLAHKVYVLSKLDKCEDYTGKTYYSSSYDKSTGIITLSCKKPVLPPTLGYGG